MLGPAPWPATQQWVGLALAADFDGDGDVDVSGILKSPTGGPALYYPFFVRNTSRHIGAPAAARLGTSLDLTLIGNDRHTMLPGIATREVRIPFLNWGDLRLDPSTLLSLPSLLVRNRVPGRARIPVPNMAALHGLVVSIQSVDVPPSPSQPTRFTNLAWTRLER